ncbi:(2Fe-2S)-binding protein [Humidesulfovibrio sp.]|uniref:(2Fe-2S)-binding protein n=1 Tax=Humidesulfovibrio sp. TaxID=2910988 RepID=UPI003526AC6F
MMLLFRLNGQSVEVETAPDRRAVDLLRDLGAPHPDVKDVKEGCGTGECGACSVLVDGVHRLSCLMLAAQLAGREVVTASGLGSEAAPHAIQRAFADHGAVQCGFCTPGMAVAAAALLQDNMAPGREDIRRAISGNLCRCTGYVMIVDAIEAAAGKMRSDPSALHEERVASRKAAKSSRKATMPSRKKAGKS